MRLAVLFSGGKDSNYALYLASQKHEVVCLISMISENKDSYMFQTPGLNFAKMQAKALEIPLIQYQTKGEKEEELKDLKSAIILAKQKYEIDGVVSGAINSTYQSSRIQNICNDLDLWCYNPLWQKNQKDYLYELIENKFEVIIISISSYPLDDSYLGKIIDQKLIQNLIELEDKFKINPAGEGGELETFVLNSPLFKKRIEITKSKKIMDSENSGMLIIEEANLVEK